MEQHQMFHLMFTPGYWQQLTNFQSDHFLNFYICLILEYSLANALKFNRLSKYLRSSAIASEILKLQALGLINATQNTEKTVAIQDGDKPFLQKRSPIGNIDFLIKQYWDTGCRTWDRVPFHSIIMFLAQTDHNVRAEVKLSRIKLLFCDLLCIFSIFMLMHKANHTI